MQETGVGFGTSGARGRVEAMTDRVCYAYAAAFLQHLEADGRGPGRLVLAGDLRPSTPRIMAAVARAAADRACEVIHCGTVPSPAVALFGMTAGLPGVMVTGSHIPDDRNGIKFTTPRGEILKADEEGIRCQRVPIPADRFDASGAFTAAAPLPGVSSDALDRYVRRYLDFFPANALAGLRVGLYEHSSVARDALRAVLDGLGAEVVALGRSERFVPVDTEAIRPEDVALAAGWAAEGGFDALVSADGDGDRPLVGDERGRWLRGDVTGILCARYLGADRVVTPVSSNTAVERCGWFERVRRTRIGSPYVIEGMQAELDGDARVVGYEANGGFLTASPIKRGGRRLEALPTRDAVIVAVALLAAARQRGVALSALLGELPARYTASDRVKAFPTEVARARIERMRSAGPAGVPGALGEDFGRAVAMDATDGLRITFDTGEVVHLRPSGNAPELRCYTEADTAERARDMTRRCLQLMEAWRE
jgi:phosphomannomutase